MAAHFNGRASAGMQDEAARLRALYQNGKVRTDLLEFTIGDVVYLRYPEGVYRDHSGKTFDPKNLFPPSDDDDGLPPWLRPTVPFRPLDFTTLSDAPDFERAWAVTDWFPMLETIGFGGAGGEGKTTIMQAMATAAALGKSYLGLNFAPMKASLLLCEDRAKDAHLRQVPINRYFGCTMKDLVGRLLILPRRGADNYLGVFDKDDILHRTPLFDQYLGAAKEFGAQFHFFDTRSDVFSGNQNNEQHARQFVRQVIDPVAEETEGVCLLAYQPSRAGKRDGSSESGSVQWDAAFRARLALTRDEEGETSTLTRVKSNFSAKDEKIDVQWHKGVFKREEEVAAETPAHEISAKLAADRRAFLSLLDQYTQIGSKVSSKPSSANYAPKAFGADKDGSAIGTKRLEQAMRKLLEDGEIINAAYGAPSRGWRHLTRKSQESF